MAEINIYGAGLAGCEAAWQAAKLGVQVKLYEMKPKKKSPAHHADTFAELVCSNSLRSAEITNAAGLLKEEMRCLGSIIMEACGVSAVSAGGAVAVDREQFSGYITEKIRSCPRITVIEEEMTAIPEDEITVIATGPLTSDGLAKTIQEKIG
ncbi:MAG: FAD-dependent oxidoreductase, partial [Clostridia bacterium]|nr:FAD-dependent oxidoreductase [Clostridia bacterium]